MTPLPGTRREAPASILFLLPPQPTRLFRWFLTILQGLPAPRPPSSSAAGGRPAHRPPHLEHSERSSGLTCSQRPVLRHAPPSRAPPSTFIPPARVRALARPAPSTWRRCPSCPPGSSRAQQPSGLSTGAPSSETLPGSPARVTVDGHESGPTHSRPRGSLSIRSRTEFSFMTHECRIHSSGGGGRLWGARDGPRPRAPCPLPHPPPSLTCYHGLTCTVAPERLRSASADTHGQKDPRGVTCRRKLGSSRLSLRSVPGLLEFFFFYS